MRIAITGATGLIGSRLVDVLRVRGDEVLIVQRADAPPPSGEPAYSPHGRGAWLEALDGVDAIVHLAGAPLGERRWNAAVRSEIYGSRVLGTKTLVDGLAKLASPPDVFIGASAIGIYGDRGDEVLGEDSAPGSGFLASVCVDWEAETARAAEVCKRVASLRTGIVLAVQGGVLARVAPLARLGLSGPLGSGRQFMSWISLEDEVRAIVHLLDTPLSGPVNVVGPAPVRNRDFAAALGHLLHRPALLPAPAFALEAVLGRQMARELLLASERVEPRVLLESGFQFAHSTIGEALAWALGSR